jgi:hypothetical protein
MNSTRWQVVGTADLDALAKAKAEALNLVQWLARIANSYVTEGTPDERTALDFRASDAAFVTKPFDKDISLEMRLPNLEMQFLENGKPVPHILDPQEHSPAEVEAWILVELLHRRVDREKFSKTLPYAIPDLMTGDAEDHAPQSCQPGLTHLMAWFQNAAAALDAAARATGTDKARIVCLPQTLNLICVSDPGAKQADFGFSPGDAENPEPFFYANVSATNGAAAGKKRSVLKASILLAESDPAAAAIKFMRLAPGA